MTSISLLCSGRILVSRPRFSFFVGEEVAVPAVEEVVEPVLMAAWPSTALDRCESCFGGESRPMTTALLLDIAERSEFEDTVDMPFDLPSSAWPAPVPSIADLGRGASPMPSNSSRSADRLSEDNGETERTLELEA